MKFRAATDAHEATLADGRPLVPSEEINLSPEEQQDAHNTRLIAEGRLISISQSDKARADAEGRVASPPPVRQDEPANDNDNNGGGS